MSEPNPKPQAKESLIVTVSWVAIPILISVLGLVALS